MLRNKIMRINKLNDDGIGLVETLVALGITIVILTSLVSLSVFTVRVSLSSKLLLEGSKLASEELERVRAVRDRAEWENGIDGFIDLIHGCDTSDCFINDSLNVSTGRDTIGTGAEQVTRFFRVTDPINGDGIDQLVSDEVVRINVTTFWIVGGNSSYSHVYTDLTNWR
jgi:Tfp pilus assembly protein PilV